MTANIYQFPPQLDCPTCQTLLRPVTRAELNLDLNNPDYRHIAEAAAQGALNWEPPHQWTDFMKDVSPPGSWLLRCDTCGNRSLWSRDDCQSESI